MTKGTLVISLDTELAWGWIARPELPAFLPLLRDTRAAIRRMLGLFDAYETAVTWAVVGRLFERSIPVSEDSDRLLAHQGLSRESVYGSGALHGGDSLVQAPDVVESILSARARHEIASHSYSHTVFGEPACDRETAELDLALAREAAAAWGVELRSFVFPRNREGHHGALGAHGFRRFRSRGDGAGPGAGSLASRLGSWRDALLATAPPTGTVTPHASGLEALPGSLLFRVPHRGVARHFPPSRLARRAIAGLRAAAASGRVLQLWLHPFNFAYRTGEHLAALEEVLRTAGRMRETGEIEIATLGGVARSHGPETG